MADTINVTIEGGGTWDGISGKPTASAESSFIVSGPTTFSWLVKTLAQVKTILGIPTTDAASDFQVGSSGSWVKKTLAEVKSILGLGSAAYTETTAYAPAPSAAQAPAFANPLALDATTHKDFKAATITGNTTVNLTGASDGDGGFIELIIDGTGGYTVALGTMFTKNSGGGTIDTTASADNIIAWMKVGSDIVYSISQIS
jgi:hypothetical protein